MADFLGILDEALRNNLQCRLALDGLMAFIPETKRAERFMDLLEAKGSLPPTISWTSTMGLKVRLYECPEGLGNIGLFQDDFHFRIESGCEEFVGLPALEDWLQDCQRSGSNLAKLKPATVPEKTWDYICKHGPLGICFLLPPSIMEALLKNPI